MELQPDSILAKWTVPQCPFSIEYSPRVLDDIRLAVTDAFFSLPRGGAEIGGLLLGRYENGRVTIVESTPMECEHAFGPSFVLSDRDHAKLSEAIAAAKNSQLKPVGWWHSHTRTEIFLSEADQQIHNKFFPEPWQLALVLKPHTFQPMRAGFFFREADGSIHAAATYQEITLEPLPMRPVGVPAPPPPVSPSPVFHETPGGRVIDAQLSQPDPPVPEVPVEAPRVEVPPPAFLSSAPPPERQSRRWTGLIAAAVGVALALGGYATRGRWLPVLDRQTQSGPNEAVALNVIDRDGQLQIRWNGAALAVSGATAGSLLILDGNSNVDVPLDARHVHSGAFTYVRKSKRVDVTLALTQPGGKEVRLGTLYTGAPPVSHADAPPPPNPAPVSADGPAVRQERDSLRKENAGLKLELARQIERNKLLDKGLEELRKAVQREQQRKRLEVQSPDTAK